ncbi:MAG: CD225/dispanin family protein [Armatimonadota bacterium]|nr:CD225/dispanin family protein [Armatimonadota bacterium]
MDLYAADAGAPGTGSPYETPSNTQFSRPASMPPPKNYLIESILATVLCCLPFGIAAIVNASKVDRLAYQGDYSGATEAANKAKTFSIVAVIVGLVVNIAYLAFMLPGMIDEVKKEMQENKPQPTMPELTVPEMYIVPK